MSMWSSITQLAKTVHPPTSTPMPEPIHRSNRSSVKNDNSLIEPSILKDIKSECKHFVLFGDNFTKLVKIKTF